MSNLVEVKNLKKYFPLSRGFLKKISYIKAVDNVSFSISKGETFGVVGESGCGKSTLSRTMIRLYEPDAGNVIINGNDITNMKANEVKYYRQDFQMVFQDPYASLNPRMTVGDIISEPLKIFKNRKIINMSRKEIKERTRYLLDVVGLDHRFINRYPHEFSGGQRQRIGIARALALNPKFVICDEPVSALDVSIQSQILNLLEDLQSKFELTYMFISHDLAVVKHISDRIAVMYLGKIVELASSNDLYNETLHPYSKALLSAIPIPNPEIEKTRKRILLNGDVPSPDKDFIGCRFKDRCYIKTEICDRVEPELEEKKKGHFCACHNCNKL